MESLRREIDPIEQEVLQTLTDELALARAALREHRDTPMWGYAYADTCGGGTNNPKLVEIREIDDQLNAEITSLDQQVRTLLSTD